jgi:large subunit ribosomal protein L35
MPKMKTKRSAVKRFRSTGTGKIKAGRTNKRHNLHHKQPKRRAQLRGNLILDRRDEKHLKKALPYGLPK